MATAKKKMSPASNKVSVKKAAVKKTQASAAGSGALNQVKRKLSLAEIELEIYREIGGLSAKGAPLKTVLNHLMACVLKAMETNAGTLYLLNESTKELSFEVVKGQQAKRLAGLRIHAEKGIAGRVVKTGRPYISMDLHRDKHWAGLEPGAVCENMMAVPLKLNKKTIGVIEVLNKTAGKEFTKEDLQALTSLSNHFSIIMERAEMVAKLDERVKQLAILSEVAGILTSSLDVSIVRKRSMEASTRLMKAETGSLFLVDEKAGELYFDVALGEKGEILKELRLKIGEGIAGWVAQKGEPVIINDVSHDERFTVKMDSKSHFKTRNMVCVPVKIKDKTIGVLQAINKHDGAFDDGDLKLFQMFAGQVAIALDNARLYGEIKEAFYNTSEALAQAIEMRDPYTGGHTKRVLWYSLATARQLGFDKEQMENVKLSAVLHDIGKIGVEDAILRKQGPLDERERAEMNKHPMYGADILKMVPQLSTVLPGMMHHHERVDGLGYPKGYKGDEIPIVARIIAVADTYDAMTTTRPYRKGLPKEVAFAELRKYSGLQFDAKVVEAFIKADAAGEIDSVPATDVLNAHVAS